MRTRQRRAKIKKSFPLRFQSTGKRDAAPKAVSEFVERITTAVDKLPPSKKRSRLMTDGSCATGLENLLNESIDLGAGLDDIRRVQAAINSAIDGLVRRRWSLSARELFYATGAETASNSRQNEDTHAVLTNGTLGDVERLRESTRIQRDMSDVVMEACDARASFLRAQARA